MCTLNFVHNVVLIVRKSVHRYLGCRKRAILVFVTDLFPQSGSSQKKHTSHARVSSPAFARVCACTGTHAYLQTRRKVAKKARGQTRDSFRHHVSGADPFRPPILFDIGPAGTLTHFVRMIVSRTFIAAAIVASNDREGGGLSAFVEFVNPSTW